ncbi:hypothetical protein [Pseudomonas atacamensis]|uniref:hypothetical protein n=1 Tax=Pseudomonas atacamensis TaxID=2565368 RepID=UPI001F20EC1C|nr:hypothetical protein [Pseudomonas atacamensis]
MDDEKEKNLPFSELIGAKLGEILVISMYQARATLTLAQAIAKDPSTSPDVKSAASDSLAVIDQLIIKLEQAVGDEALTLIRDFVGRTDHE